MVEQRRVEGQVRHGVPNDAWPIKRPIRWSTPLMLHIPDDVRVGAQWFHQRLALAVQSARSAA
ncbi:hypothetical protein, partial [Nocardia sp. NPDC060259]|uniref:hypothetical protein n=1 Tax=Nocardia sp. NPDC060259 TaxID=3347088 RepID=UPI00365DE548